MNLKTDVIAASDQSRRLPGITRVLAWTHLRCAGADVRVHERTVEHSSFFVQQLHVSPLEQLQKAQESVRVCRTSTGWNKRPRLRRVYKGDAFERPLVLVQHLRDRAEAKSAPTCCSRFCFLNWMPSSSRLRRISSRLSALFL